MEVMQGTKDVIQDLSIDVIPGIPFSPIDANKVAKDDDARVPIELWDNWIWKLSFHSPSLVNRFRCSYHLCPLQSLQQWLLRVWRRCLTQEAITNLNTVSHQREVEKEAVRECVEKASKADWWDWKGGSRIFFWRWPIAHREFMRKGHPVFVKGTLPRYRKPQPSETDGSVQLKMQAKLENVLDKGYIRPGRVKSLTGYFGVLKGPTDIRMVYDATRSGLNATLWSPNFGLPTVETLLCG